MKKKQEEKPKKYRATPPPKVGIECEESGESGESFLMVRKLA
jgi:hypothetical protein